MSPLYDSNSFNLQTEIKDDLKGIAGLSEHAIHETLACSWEYARCVIPVYTNWERYLAFLRIIIIGIVAEFDGVLVADDVSAGDGHVLGYDMGLLFDTLFGDTPGSGREDMAREFRTFLVTTAGKSSDRRSTSELFRRYVDALAVSPKSWFRIRDADGLSRFTIACALSCNDVTAEETWFSEDQFQVLGEIMATLYDAVAFYKHRAEGETNNTYAYVDPALRVEAYRRAREVLWALDVAWARGRLAGRLHAVNFLRLIGGPIHMTMRRYRYVEDGMVIGKPETEDVVDLTRQHFKLWNRVDSSGDHDHVQRDVDVNVGLDDTSYVDVILQSDRLLFCGLKELLQMSERKCAKCRYKRSYGAETLAQFGGVELCAECRTGWGVYMQSLPQRAADAFPEIRETQLRL
ncbi:hypothetical protein B0H66DRAFT_626150 [Apodospora peruviana]|uniref:ABA 3 protein n=1 Tax=Apodospora peruviana TaxID=516989 RepID=A0AAE0I198_9PEZI|nr:hypothetical protein B0H66DRAFT_626150 [Apodospora peruviana]